MGETSRAGQVVQSAQKHSRNRGGNQVCHGSGKHRSHAQLREVVAPLGYQGADSADLHSDRAEIGKAAQGKRSNGERSWEE